MFATCMKQWLTYLLPVMPVGTQGSDNETVNRIIIKLWPVCFQLIYFLLIICSWYFSPLLCAMPTHLHCRVSWLPTALPWQQMMCSSTLHSHVYIGSLPGFLSVYKQESFNLCVPIVNGIKTNDNKSLR